MKRTRGKKDKKPLPTEDVTMEEWFEDIGLRDEPVAKEPATRGLLP